MNFKQLCYLVIIPILTLLLLQSCNSDTIYTQVIKNNTEHEIVLSFSGSDKYESTYTIIPLASKTILFEQKKGTDDATSMDCNLASGLSISGIALVKNEGIITDTLTLNTNLTDSSLWAQTSNEKGDIVVTCSVNLSIDKFN